LESLAKREKQFAQQIQAIRNTNEQQRRALIKQHDSNITTLKEDQTNKQQQFEKQLYDQRQLEKELLDQLSTLQQQINIQLLNSTEREKEFATQLQETQKIHELQRMELGNVYTEWEKKLNTQLSNKQDELTHLTQKWFAIKQDYLQILKNQRHQLDSVQGTYSWRWTAPLRNLAKLFGKKTIEEETNNLTPLLTSDHNLLKNEFPLNEFSDQSKNHISDISDPTTSNNPNENYLTEFRAFSNMTPNQKYKIATTLDELLSYHDKNFIHSAYLIVLGRTPDAEGSRYYLERLRSGISKVEILTQLRLSKEGRTCRLVIPELEGLIKRHKLLKTPLLGVLLQMIGVKQPEDNMEKSLRAVENRIYIQQVRIQQFFTKTNILLTRLSLQSNQNRQTAHNEFTISTFTGQDNTKFRILLVSYYCPTRAHAGGLRILDIYALIRKQCPNIQIDLLTFHRPSIDWSLDNVHFIFHNVYLSPTEDLSPDVLLALRGSPLNYNVIDLQFHPLVHQIDAFRHIGRKIIFTPMESLSKVTFMNFKTNFLTTNNFQLVKETSSLKLAAEEVLLTLKADEVVCVSRSDAAFLRAVTSSRRVRSMDTGVSQFEFSDALAPNFVCTNASNRRCNIIFVAYFGSPTNISALRWYIDNVHPIVKAAVPAYVLTVIGRGDLSAFTTYRDISIKFVGEVDAIAPFIQEARVGIAVALTGSGFRGKVNQYAILGVPSVVSPIAHKGLAYQDEENIFIAESPELFAERCILLLTDFEMNDRMGQAARELCLRKYTWQSKWPIIRNIYNLEKWS
jgi:glycosyltransferase involved in cell wall biosynthesis